MAPGAGRAVVGGGSADSGLSAPGGGTRWLPGRRETAPETPARVYPAAGLRGCDCPRVDVRTAGQNWRRSRPVDGCSWGEKLDCPGKFLFRDQTGIAL